VSSAFGLGPVQSGALPTLSAESGHKLAVNTKLVFKKSSSYDYSKECIDGAPVSFIASNDGTPPVQVLWKGGFKYVHSMIIH